MVVKWKELSFCDQGFSGGDDFEDTEGDSLHFVDGFNFSVAGLGSEECSKLAVSVETGVVHFRNKDMVVLVEKIDQSVWKRVNMTKIDRANFVAFGNHPVSCFFDRAVSGTPADEEK